MFCSIFRYPAFKARSELAIIDHNQHSRLKQATNEFGEPLFSRCWSKKAGRWVPIIVKERKNYDYIPYLMTTILDSRRRDNGSEARSVLIRKDDPRFKAKTIAKLPPKPTKELVKTKQL